MNSEAWKLSVRRLEAEAKRAPRAYRLRVAAVAALGYAYLGGVLLVLSGGVAAAVVLELAGYPDALKAVFPLCALAFVIVRALPMKLRPPEGIELSRADGVELFTLIERLCERVGAPRIHRVAVNGDLNAGVAQIPRFGPFGPSRNHLTVGLPILDTLSADEFCAVLAHELGHLSGRQGRLSAWVYRIRETWTLLLVTLEAEGHWGTVVFRPFFQWYVPFFSAYSFVLAREHEYQADRVAADAAGKDAAASALARLALVGAYLGEVYWPRVYRKVDRTPKPDTRPFAALAGALRASSPDDFTPFARAAMAEETGTDTHPALTDRLAALEVPTAEILRIAASPVELSAAERYVGPARDRLADRLDADWLDAVSASWREEYRAAKTAQARLAQLEAGRREEFDTPTLLEYAGLVERFRGTEAALQLYQAARAGEPGNAIANYCVGRALLANGDGAGLAYLEAAMAADPEAVLPGCEIAAAFLTEHGRAAEAVQYGARATERVEALENAYAERETLSRRNEICEHDLPAAVVDDLAGQLASHPDVRRAYLARRVLGHLDEEFPSYVLGVELRVPRWKEFAYGAALGTGVGFLRPNLCNPRVNMIRRLSAELHAPFGFFVVDLKESGRVKRRIRKLAGSEIYAQER